MCETFLLHVICFDKQWLLNGLAVGARHTKVLTAATRTHHFAVLNTGFSLTPPSVRQCVMEVNVWLFLLTRICEPEGFGHVPAQAGVWHGKVDAWVQYNPKS
jgi:hypothetical protein